MTTSRSLPPPPPPKRPPHEHPPHFVTPSDEVHYPHCPRDDYIRSKSYHHHPGHRTRKSSDSPSRRSTPHTPRSVSIQLPHGTPPSPSIPRRPVTTLPSVPRPAAGLSVPLPSQSRNPMMMYGQGGPWSMGAGAPGMGMGGMPGMGMGMNPYLMAQGQGQGQGQFGPAQSPGDAGAGGFAGSAAHTDAAGNDLKPFDSSQLKRGRMGHYGYLDGRELAGPPVGYLPAGAENLPPAPNHGPGQTSPSTAPGGSYYPQIAPSGTASRSQSQASGSTWGGGNIMPQARYDGRSAHGRYIQADTDTPYPRNKAGGMSASWTRYEGEEPLELDGRYSVGHRMREGRV